MKIQTKVYFVSDDNERFFGEGPYHLLELVKTTGSLRRAAVEMGLSYSKALKIIRRAETALNCMLTERTIGGPAGGGSRLTPEAEVWMDRYLTYRNRSIQTISYPDRASTPRVGCVIMASGLGKRFGSNKLMADFCGEPLILRILQATEGIFAHRVVVTRHQEVKDYVEQYVQLRSQSDISVVLHDLPYRSDTVRLGLEALGDMDAALFTPSDQPLLSRTTIRALVDSALALPAIWRPIADGQEGTPVLFPRSLFPELMHLPENKGGNVVIRAHRDQVRLLPLSDPLELADADTPEALAALAAAALEAAVKER